MLCLFNKLLVLKGFFPLSQEEHKKEKEPPRFQLSSLSPQERIDYSHLIEELGESSA